MAFRRLSSNARFTLAVIGVSVLFGLMAPLLAMGPSGKHSPKVQEVYSVVVRSMGDCEVGKPMVVAIRVKNISDHPVSFRSYSFYPAYSYYRWLLTHNGKPVETTAFHRMLFGQQRPEDPPAIASGSHMYSSIAPNDGFELAADLNKMFVITEPGEYSLQIELRDQDGSSPKSNILVLKIQ